MLLHRSFSRRSKAESEKLSEKTHESFREDIASDVFTSAPYIEHEVEDRWMETLLQGRKADATNRSVGFSDSLNGIENYVIIFKYT